MPHRVVCARARSIEETCGTVQRCRIVKSCAIAHWDRHVTRTRLCLKLILEHILVARRLVHERLADAAARGAGLLDAARIFLALAHLRPRRARGVVVGAHVCTKPARLGTSAQHPSWVVVALVSGHPLVAELLRFRVFAPIVIFLAFEGELLVHLAVCEEDRRRVAAHATSLRARLEHELGIGVAGPFIAPRAAVLVEIFALGLADTARNRTAQERILRLCLTFTRLRQPLASVLILCRVCVPRGMIGAWWRANSTSHRTLLVHEHGVVGAFALQHPIQTFRRAVVAFMVAHLARAGTSLVHEELIRLAFTLQLPVVAIHVLICAHGEHCRQNRGEHGRLSHRR